MTKFKDVNNEEELKNIKRLLNDIRKSKSQEGQLFIDGHVYTVEYKWSVDEEYDN